MRETSSPASARAPADSDPLWLPDDDPAPVKRRGRPRKDAMRVVPTFIPIKRPRGRLPKSADPLAVVDLAPLPADLEKLRLITIAEAQAVLRCSRMTIWNLRQAGRLRTVAIGNAARVPLADVQHVIRTSTEGI